MDIFIFFLQHQIISNRESIVFLNSEKQHETKAGVHVQRSVRQPPPMPKMRYPEHVEVEWIQLAHIYTIGYELVCHCLEMCGLRQETVRKKNVLLAFNRKPMLIFQKYVSGSNSV